MALDEAILTTVGSKNALPTMRLYAWEPACLSLGHAQPVSDVNQAALQANAWDLVRRPTGGRAILHTDELTYAVIAAQDEPLVAGSILESYQRIASGLLRALVHMNLKAQADQEYALPAGAQPKAPICFEVPSNYEITVAGKKLIGSAQARKLGGVLQHGSLPLYGDLTRITRALVYSGEEERQIAAQRLLGHATTAESILGQPVEWQAAADSFQCAFEECFNIRFEISQPSEAELDLAAELQASKYAHPSWTERL